MDKTVLCIGPCKGMEDMLSPSGYTVKRVDGRDILEVPGKEGASAVL